MGVGAEREAGLAVALAQVYRTPTTIERVAEQAGLDTSHLALVNVSPADAWYAIMQAAVRDGKVDALRALVQRERGRDKELMAAWDDYDQSVAAPEDAPPAPPEPPRKRTPYPEKTDMSEIRADERRDARIDQMQRDMADMRVQIAGLVAQVSALTEMVRKQSEHDAPTLSNAQFTAILIAFLFLASLVFAAVYYGGNR